MGQIVIMQTLRALFFYYYNNFLGFQVQRLPLECNLQTKEHYSTKISLYATFPQVKIMQYILDTPHEQHKYYIQSRSEGSTAEKSNKSICIQQTVCKTASNAVYTCPHEKSRSS